MRVFVSAASGQFKECRDQLASDLRAIGCEVRVQEDFQQGPRTLLERLEEYVAQCDRVIAIIGEAYGANASSSTAQGRSYTQWEYFFATGERLSGTTERPRDLFVYLASDAFSSNYPVTQSADHAERQREFRRFVTSTGKHYSQFDSVDHLCRLVLRDGWQMMDRPRPFLYVHPPKAPTYFVGRGFELRQLGEALAQTRPCVIVVVGIGGQGKSTLLHRCLEDGRTLPPGIWCTAYRGGFSFDEFIDTALDRLSKEPFDKSAMPDKAARLRRLMARLQADPVLLVIDGMERWLRGWAREGPEPIGAEAMDDRRGVESALDEFLEQVSGLTNGTHVVLTSRAVPAALDDTACALVPVYDENHRFALEGLDDDAAVTLLRDLGVIGDSRAIREVAQQYNNHPLALMVLGRLLFKKYGGRMEALMRVSALDPHKRLYELLEETRHNLPGGRRSIEFLRAASHCLENPSLAAIGAALGDDGCDSTETEELLALAVMLSDWNVLEWDAEREVVGLHPLVREFFGANSPESDAIHHRLARWYGKQDIPASAVSLEDMRPRILTIEHALRAGEGPYCAELLFLDVVPGRSFVEWISAHGHLSFGEELLCRIAPQCNVQERANVSLVRTSWLRHLGDFARALAELDRTVALLDDTATAVTRERLITLAGAFMNRGNVHREIEHGYDAALADYDRAISILRDPRIGVPTPDLELAMAWTNRANVCRDEGHTSKAIEDYCRAIRMLSSLSMDTPNAALTLAMIFVNRANAHGDRRDWTAALNDFASAAEIYRHVPTTHRSETDVRSAEMKISQGIAFLGAGCPREGLAILTEALSLLTRLVDGGRLELEPSVALAYHNRSLVQVGMGNGEDAIRDSVLAVATYERLVDSGRHDLTGWLAHATVVRSQLLYPNDPVASRRDREDGWNLMRRMVAHGQTDARIILLRTAAQIAIQVEGVDRQSCVAALNTILAECAEILQRSDAPEALRMEVDYALASLGEAPDLPGIDAALLERLRRRLRQ
jgi:tetratricopeptide (TPR) repeat protein